MFRFSKKEKIQVASYYKIIKNVLSRVRFDSTFANLSLHDNSPFLNGILSADENGDHYKSIRGFFQTVIEFRHLGFPTPILDWTKNPYIAAFFALSNVGIDDNIAVYRIKKRENKSFSIFGPQIYLSEFEFKGYGYRHDNQEAMYTIAITQNHSDTCYPKDKRTGPYFDSLAYKDLEQSNVEVEKYVIIDSKEKRLIFLQELYNCDYSFERIYGKTHPLENTMLRDLAIQEILLSKERDTVCYPW